MFNKAIKIAVIVIFFLITAVAALFSDFEGGKISETQNRTLASFPDLTNEDMTFESFTDEFEAWCNDNVGFRESYNQLYTRFNTTLNIPTNDRVHLGKDGFYFTTGASSVRIATGEHVISENKLRIIAENQQEISDYYKEKGKLYYLVLVPGKASVYPEKIRGGNFEVTETTVDIIEKYLTENTDVKVINVKKALLESKEQGNLVFMKTDTHWTAEGAYAAYNTIMDRMVSDGVVTQKVDFSPDFDTTETTIGDLSNMIGENALKPEEISVAKWNCRYMLDNDSAEYKAVSDAIDSLAKISTVEISRNEQRYINTSNDTNPLSLQIYGDSLYLNFRQINQFFAENFDTVQYLRIRSVCEPVDNVVDSDIVIFSAFERLCESVLVNPPLFATVPSVLENLEEISVDKADKWIGNKGVYISPKNKELCTIDGTDIIFDKSFETCEFAGWAFDYNQKTDLNDLFIFADDELLQINYGLSGEDVGKYLGYENVRNCRFKFILSRDYLIENDVQQLKFVMVSSDGIHKYEPVVYNIKLK